jgi:hypothetical protein
MSNRLAVIPRVWIALTFPLFFGVEASAQEKPTEKENNERLARSPRQVAEQLAAPPPM